MGDSQSTRATPVVAAGLFEVEPERFAAVGRDDAQFDLRVRLAGERIAMRVDRPLLSGVVNNGIKRNRAFIGFLVNNLSAIGRPPITGVPIHLLFGHEFGQAVRDAIRRPLAELNFLAGRDVEDKQLSIPDEGDFRAIGVQFGIDLRRGGVGQAFERPGAALKVEIAAEGTDRDVGVLA